MRCAWLQKLTWRKSYAGVAHPLALRLLPDHLHGPEVNGPEENLHHPLVKAQGGILNVAKGTNPYPFLTISERLWIDFKSSSIQAISLHENEMSCEILHACQSEIYDLIQ